MNYFASRESVEIVDCLSGKNIENVDLSWKLYSIQEGIARLYEEISHIENGSSSKVDKEVSLRRVNDLLHQHLNKKEALEKKLDESSSKDCGHEKISRSNHN